MLRGVRVHVYCSFAFGVEFFRNGWNLFDAIVIILTMVFALLEKLLTSVLLLRILRLRSVLRLFRLMVIFGRIKQTSDTVKRIRARNARFKDLQSPVERSLHILHDLSTLRTLSSQQRSDLEYVIQMLASGRMYGPAAIMGGRDGADGEDSAASVDDETTAWLRGYMQPTRDTASEDRVLTVNDEELMDAHRAGALPVIESESDDDGAVGGLLAGCWRVGGGGGGGGGVAPVRCGSVLTLGTRTCGAVVACSRFWSLSLLCACVCVRVRVCWRVRCIR